MSTAGKFGDDTNKAHLMDEMEFVFRASDLTKSIRQGGLQNRLTKKLFMDAMQMMRKIP